LSSSPSIDALGSGLGRLDSGEPSAENFRRRRLEMAHGSSDGFFGRHASFLRRNGVCALALVALLSSCNLSRYDKAAHLTEHVGDVGSRVTAMLAHGNGVFVGTSSGEIHWSDGATPRRVVRGTGEVSSLAVVVDPRATEVDPFLVWTTADGTSIERVSLGGAGEQDPMASPLFRAAEAPELSPRAVVAGDAAESWPGLYFVDAEGRVWGALADAHSEGCVRAGDTECCKTDAWKVNPPKEIDEEGRNIGLGCVDAPVEPSGGLGLVWSAELGLVWHTEDGSVYQRQDVAPRKLRGAGDTFAAIIAFGTQVFGAGQNNFVRRWDCPDPGDLSCADSRKFVGCGDGQLVQTIAEREVGFQSAAALAADGTFVYLLVQGVPSEQDPDAYQGRVVRMRPSDDTCTVIEDPVAQPLLPGRIAVTAEAVYWSIGGRVYAASKLP
jgi:hypothetical protein